MIAREIDQHKWFISLTPHKHDKSIRGITFFTYMMKNIA